MFKTRYIAHITIEAETPLKVGSSNREFLQDSPIQKDFNNLPLILGTSIAGVLRRAFKDKANEIFGKEEGSFVIFSNALLVDENGKVCQKLLTEKSSFLKLFDKLPIREHTAISKKGVAKDNSKFDEEVVYRGSRFRFSIEMIEHKEEFEKLLQLLKENSFRLGSGSTKGFGKFKILQIKTEVIDSIQKLVSYSSSLNYFDFSKDEDSIESINDEKYIRYNLKITPDDFFMFGSGFGDDEADITPVYERTIDYKNRALSDEMILIPASSIKGALSHRTAFYYNKIKKLYTADERAKTGEENPAVNAIFGHKKELDQESKKELGAKGAILISDCYKTKVDEKVFDHVSIDRFTGGAIDGALFQEKTVADDREYEIEILIKSSLKGSEELKAFERAIKDITTGMLPLGGATTKGHGVFSGKVLKDGVEI